MAKVTVPVVIELTLDTDLMPDREQSNAEWGLRYGVANMVAQRVWENLRSYRVGPGFSYLVRVEGSDPVTGGPMSTTPVGRAVA